MPRCPECGEEITYLINVCEEIVESIFELDSLGEADYDHVDSWLGEMNEYRCPICYEVLFNSEEEAVEFLKPKAKQATLPVEG
jgi:hypothetical protein